jgi:PiT family inorganic phosphate transporter
MLVYLLSLIGCVFIAFVIGSNDTSNAFGVCIGCNIIRFKKALLLFGPFVLIGILLQGQKVMKTIGSDLLNVNISILGISLLVSALLIAFSNFKKLPVSSHQVIVGSLTGSGVASGIDVDIVSVAKIVISWVISPLGALIFALLIYKIMEKTLSRLPVFRVDILLRSLLVLTGILISYTTGANELATVLGGAVYAGLISPVQASLGGAVLVFLGAVFLSSRVIETVGKGITTLDPFSGFAAQFGGAACVFVFTGLGMPVSTTYCIIGGVIGVGMLKGMGTVRLDLLRKMLLSWVLTPLCAFSLCFALTKILDKLTW